MGDEWPPRRLPLLCLLLLLPLLLPLLLRVLLLLLFLLLVLLPLLRVLPHLVQDTLENAGGDGASGRVELWIRLSCNLEMIFVSGSAAGKQHTKTPRGLAQQASLTQNKVQRHSSRRCTHVIQAPWPNGQGVGLLIQRLRVRVPKGVPSRACVQSSLILVGLT